MVPEFTYLCNCTPLQSKFPVFAEFLYETFAFVYSAIQCQLLKSVVDLVPISKALQIVIFDSALDIEIIEIFSTESRTFMNHTFQSK